jgi:hypothetical protein
MADSAIIKEIKAAVDAGMKISAPVQNRLVLAALLQLYEANTELVDALALHVKESGAEMNHKLDNHENRIKTLEGHDLLSLAWRHPKIAIFIFIVLLALWSFRTIIFEWLGLPPDLGI